MTTSRSIEIGKVAYDLKEFLEWVKHYETIGKVAASLGCRIIDIQIALNYTLPGWNRRPGDTLAEKLNDYT